MQSVRLFLKYLFQILTEHIFAAQTTIISLKEIIVIKIFSCKIEVSHESVSLIGCAHFSTFKE